MAIRARCRDSSSALALRTAASAVAPNSRSTPRACSQANGWRNARGSIPGATLVRSRISRLTPLGRSRLAACRRWRVRRRFMRSRTAMAAVDTATSELGTRDSSQATFISSSRALPNRRRSRRSWRVSTRWRRTRHSGSHTRSAMSSRRAATRRSWIASGSDPARTRRAASARSCVPRARRASMPRASSRGSCARAEVVLLVRTRPAPGACGSSTTFSKRHAPCAALWTCHLKGLLAAEHGRGAPGLQDTELAAKLGWV